MTVETMTASGPQQIAECGTEGAYRRHLRKGEPIDEKCREGHRVLMRSYGPAAAAQKRAKRTAGRLPRSAAERQVRERAELTTEGLTDGWWMRAACQNTAPLFDHIGSEPTTSHRRAARDYCARCPVIRQCALAADLRNEPGLWAGSYRTGSRTYHPLIKGAPERRVP